GQSTIDGHKVRFVAMEYLHDPSLCDSTEFEMEMKHAKALRGLPQNAKRKFLDAVLKIHRCGAIYNAIREANLLYASTRTNGVRKSYIIDFGMSILDNMSDGAMELEVTYLDCALGLW
ncbi:hypothetical protein EV175_000664, partial [Coemansia sp. RSA 1933]